MKNSQHKSSIMVPILLLFWIPMTIGVVASLYYHIRWDYFGITEGINPYYTTNFESSLDSYLWVASQLGFIGMSLFVLLAIFYLLISKTLIEVILYC
jgi:hypothetical protein